jgi:hypothetical protein
VNEIEIPIEYRRINTASLYIAVWMKKWLEQRFGRPFAIGVSTRNYVFLDCDRKDKLLEFVEFCRGICMELADYGFVYETPNGYHFACKAFLPHDRWRMFYALLRDRLIKRPELQEIVDLAHIEATLRRGYVTLRLNQIRRVCTIYPSGEIRYEPVIGERR